MNKKLFVTIAALTVLALPTFAAKTEKEGKGERHGGTVKAVSSDSHTLTVSHGKKDKSETYKVAKEVDLSKVKVGDNVQLKVSDANVVEAITPAKKKDK
ncbi:MAG TPA: copper-binding protein [Verrucomicrobiae bacterium]